MSIIHPRASCICFFFFSSRRRHTRLQGDWSSDVCSSDLKLIEQLGIENIEAVFLLLAAGNSLRERGLYRSAKPLLKQAGKLCERIKGPEEPLTTHCITSLACLYEQAGPDDRAEPLYQRAPENQQCAPETKYVIIA